GRLQMVWWRRFGRSRRSIYLRASFLPKKTTTCGQHDHRDRVPCEGDWRQRRDIVHPVAPFRIARSQLKRALRKPVFPFRWGTQRRENRRTARTPRQSLIPKTIVIGVSIVLGMYMHSRE